MGDGYASGPNGVCDPDDVEVGEPVLWPRNEGRRFQSHAEVGGGRRYPQAHGWLDDFNGRAGVYGLSPAEQFKYTLSLARVRRRHSAMTRVAAREAFATLPTLH